MGLAVSTELQSVVDVPIPNVLEVWPRVKPLVELALDRDPIRRYEPIDVLGAILKGTVKLWIAWNYEANDFDAAIVTEIIKYPRLSTLRIWLIGGRNMRDWIEEAKATLEAFARHYGCAAMEGGNRPGWLRIGGEGWVKTGISYEKRLA